MKGTRASTRKKFPGLGEGRSNPIYIEPTVKDTAVLIAFYNPARFKRSLKNILFLVETFRAKRIPYFVAECVFNGAKPQIPGATLVVHSNSYMFYKEQLLNKLEPLVPAQYTKLVMLDGDILFDAPDWIDQISYTLNKYDIIQPYSYACWLNPMNTKIQSKKYSYAYALNNEKPITPKHIHSYHAGFAWALKRSTFKAIGGFYDRAIIGNGDMLFVCNFLPFGIPDSWINDTVKTRFTVGEWPAYNANFKRVAPKLGYLDMKALHLFHGLTSSRQYKTRYSAVAHMLKKPWDETIELNTDGMYEFKDPAMKHILLSYFRKRDEDIPISTALHQGMMTRRRGQATAALPSLLQGLNRGVQGADIRI